MTTQDSDEMRRQSFVRVPVSKVRVQSNPRREGNFTTDNPPYYIMIGLLVTVVFVLTL